MEERKHTRVPLQEIRETSADGVYLTKEELRKYGVFAGLIFILLALVALFDRNH